jgi:streptomycin 6-kinase
VVPIPRALAEAAVLREGAAGRRWLRELPSIVANACDRWECTPDGDPWHGQVALVVPVRHACGAEGFLSAPGQPRRGRRAALIRRPRRRAAHRRRRLPLPLIDGARRADDPGGPSRQQLRSVGRGSNRDRRRPRGTAGRSSPAGHLVACWNNRRVGGAAQRSGRRRSWCPAGSRHRSGASTIHHLANDTTSTVLHGDLHIANILRSRREPWLAIDPKGWSGTAAWDAFTVIAGRRKELHQDGDLHRGIVDRVQRFSAAARVDADLALTCCQARAVSSYLYQHIIAGAWFDLEFLRVLAHGARRP